MTHYLSVTGVALLLNVSVRTVHREIKARKIPHRRIGARRLFDPVEVLRYYDTHNRVHCKP